MDSDNIIAIPSNAHQPETPTLLVDSTTKWDSRHKNTQQNSRTETFLVESQHVVQSYHTVFHRRRKLIQLHDTCVQRCLHGENMHLLRLFENATDPIIAQNNFFTYRLLYTSLRCFQQPSSALTLHHIQAPQRWPLPLEIIQNFCRRLQRQKPHTNNGTKCFLSSLDLHILKRIRSIVLNSYIFHTSNILSQANGNGPRSKALKSTRRRYKSLPQFRRPTNEIISNSVN